MPLARQIASLDPDRLDPLDLDSHFNAACMRDVDPAKEPALHALLGLRGTSLDRGRPDLWEAVVADLQRRAETLKGAVIACFEAESLVACAFLNDDADPADVDHVEAIREALMNARFEVSRGFDPARIRSELGLL